MSEQIIDLKRFEDFIKYIVKDINPCNKIGKGELLGYIKYRVSNWFDREFKVYNKIGDYAVTVNKIGQSKIQVKVLYEYFYRQQREIAAVGILSTRREAILRSSDRVMMSFVSEELRKNGQQKNPMLELLMEKLTT